MLLPKMLTPSRRKFAPRWWPGIPPPPISAGTDPNEIDGIEIPADGEAAAGFCNSRLAPGAIRARAALAAIPDRSSAGAMPCTRRAPRPEKSGALTDAALGKFGGAATIWDCAARAVHRNNAATSGTTRVAHAPPIVALTRPRGASCAGVPPSQNFDIQFQLIETRCQRPPILLPPRPALHVLIEERKGIVFPPGGSGVHQVVPLIRRMA